MTKEIQLFAEEKVIPAKPQQVDGWTVWPWHGVELESGSNKQEPIYLALFNIVKDRHTWPLDGLRLNKSSVSAKWSCPGCGHHNILQISIQGYPPLTILKTCQKAGCGVQIEINTMHGTGKVYRIYRVKPGRKKGIRINAQMEIK